MTRIVPLRLIIWQNSHLRLTDALTFISYLFLSELSSKKHKTGHRTPFPGEKLITGPDTASLPKLSLISCSFLTPAAVEMRYRNRQTYKNVYIK
jgi:hypothetical protein